MMILGHRGMPNRAVTENTVLSFTRAMQAGADGIECDIWLTKDGELVAGHDKNLARIAGDGRKMKDLTGKELTNLELRGAGSVPTLNDIIVAVPAPACLDLEIKDREAAEKLITKLKTSAALRSRTMVSSFHMDVLNKFKESLPDVQRVALLSSWYRPIRGKTFWNEVFQTQPTAIGLKVRAWNKYRVNWIKAKGYKTATWDEWVSVRQAKRMVKLGIDISITFKPDVCRQYYNDLMHAQEPAEIAN